MGDRACWLEFCSECDAQVTVVDDECLDCGADLRCGRLSESDA